MGGRGWEWHTAVLTKQRSQKNLTFPHVCSKRCGGSWCWQANGALGSPGEGVSAPAAGSARRPQQLLASAPEVAICGSLVISVTGSF